MKEYILIKKSVPVGVAVNSAAHASLVAHLAWQHLQDYDKWVYSSFKKTCCAVDDAQFEKAKTFGFQDVDYKVITESRLNDQEVAIVFFPFPENHVIGEEFLKWAKFLPLYGKGLDGPVV